jgi:protease IV
LDTIGVKVETIKSSPLKASPNGLEPTTPEAQAAIAAVVSDSYDWFKGLVKERRKLDSAGLMAVSDGRVFTGRQGIGLHLVDDLGEEREAIQYLEKSRGVAKGLPIVDWKRSAPFSGFGLFGAMAGAARVLGLPVLANVIEQTGQLTEGKSLDGVMAIWQVQNDN